MQKASVKKTLRVSQLVRMIFEDRIKEGVNYPFMHRLLDGNKEKIIALATEDTDRTFEMIKRRNKYWWWYNLKDKFEILIKK